MANIRISPERFDGGAIWPTLTAEAQAAIGAAALEVVAARSALEATFNDRETAAYRAVENAWCLADEHLDQAFLDHVSDCPHRDVQDRVKLPSVVGRVCLACGCSQNDACAGGCGWAEKHLCTACVGKAVS